MNFFNFFVKKSYAHSARPLRAHLLEIQTGFSLIEMMIAIIVIAILSAIIIPNLGTRTEQYHRKQFIAQLNTLLAYAWQQSITTRSVHGIEFNIKNSTITLFKQEAGKEEHLPVRGGFSATRITIPSTLQFTSLIIEGFDELSRFATKKTKSVWFYIVPEGLSQSVSFSIKDRSAMRKNKMSTSHTYILNPFLAQFSEKT